MTHPAQWDGLEGIGWASSVIFANAEIQKYNQTNMEPIESVPRAVP